MAIQVVLFIVCLVVVIGVAGYVLAHFLQQKNVKAMEQVIEEGEETRQQGHFSELETPTIVKNEESKIYLVKGDRTDSYKITVRLNNEVYEKEYYAYVSTISREQILNEFYYVNEREIVLIDEEGEHYYNQQAIERIDFIHRKILTSQIDQEEQEVTDVPEKQEVLQQEQIRENEGKEETEEKQEIDNDSNVSNEEQFSTVALESKPKKFFKKDKNRKQSLKPMQAKTFNRLFLASLVLLVSISVLGFTRTLGLSSRVDKVQASVTQLPKEFAGSNESNYSSIYRMNFYMEGFFEAYIPLSTNSVEMSTRNEALKSYFADNVSLKLESSTVNREFISSELIDVDTTDKIIHAKYRVVSLTEQAEEKVKDQSVYVVHLVENNGKFSLVSLPSISKNESFKTGFSGIEVEEEGNKLTDADHTNVNDFCELFLKKYASGTEAELEYMMNDVESMGEAYTLESIDTSEYYDSEGSIHGYVRATFKENATSALHQEDFSFEISKEGDQYKIIKMNHYLGGLN
ncbi:conjugal transfer protein [Enterococcus mundtii]|uniref:Conjugal transfer protein n=1 Tax=Enterococcus mundtii TaxID=53346 RepID=A0A2T5DAU7_ENTMU|nr:conjugal transfer protein [Enterococcus mundtii]PTO34754.1 hypothetical protein C6N14_10725 [Enterococcus mundtii]